MLRHSLALALFLSSAAAPRASKRITVFDAANYSQNLLTAARSLQQINQQVQQLANEAQMLVNQAQNLTRLPTTIAADLQRSLGEVDALIRDAGGLAYDIATSSESTVGLFRKEYAAATFTSRIVQDAQEAWELAREGFEHSLKIQAEVVVMIRTDTGTLDRLVAESQSAVGNLQATQAGNQLTALAGKQSMQLQSLLAASARADGLEAARALAVREQARARSTRFMGDGSAYTRR
jgi:P-type conjugative transfer protein TrbJ